MTLKSIPYPIRWRSQLDSTRCTELFATSTSSDRKSTRLNSSHSQISYAVFCLKKKKHQDFLMARIFLLARGICHTAMVYCVRAEPLGRFRSYLAKTHVVLHPRVLPCCKRL